MTLGATVSACGSNAVEPIHSRALFGFNDDPSPSTFALQAKLNMPVRRIAVPWNAVEPARGRWNWGRYDAYYEQMIGSGLKPLIVAIGGPCWASRPGASCVNGFGGVPDPRFDAAWAGYVRRLVARYPRAIGIEVWNEPNSAHQFPPHPDPIRYTALLAAAYRAVKRIRPRMPVISGGLLPGTTTNPQAVADSEFLAAMYRAGAAPHMDAIGAHPYPVAFAPGGAGGRYDKDTTEDGLNRIRQVRGEMGRVSTPIWITEVGVSASPGASLTAGVDESEQAAEIVSLLRTVGGDDDVHVALVHRLIDPPMAPNAGVAAQLQWGFGVFDSSGTPKPAACALSKAFEGSLHC